MITDPDRLGKLGMRLLRLERILGTLVYTQTI